MSLGTFAIACGHFLTEMFYFGTLSMNVGSISPILVASACALVADASGFPACHGAAVQPLSSVVSTRLGEECVALGRQEQCLMG